MYSIKASCSLSEDQMYKSISSSHINSCLCIFIYTVLYITVYAAGRFKLLAYICIFVRVCSCSGLNRECCFGFQRSNLPQLNYKTRSVIEQQVENFV